MPQPSAAAPDMPDEEERLAALAAYAVLDTEREPEFDDVAMMAARACGTPIAYVSFVGRGRQWLKAAVGVERGNLPDEGSLCRRTLREGEILLVPDLAADPASARASLLFGAPALRFYAGVPLRAPEGAAIGTLCVLDRRPRELDEPQLFILRALARTVMAQLDLRRALAARDRAASRERRAETRARQVLDSAVDYGIITLDLGGRVTGWSEGARRITGWAEGEMLGRPASVIFTPEDVAAGQPEREMRAALERGRGPDERWHLRRGGERFWADGEMMPLREESGEVAGFFKIMRDRTERRAAERDLRENRERFDAATASGLVGFLAWDGRSGLVRGDARAAAFLGTTPEQAAAGLDGWALLARVHGADRDGVARKVTRAFEGGGPFVAEFRLGAEPRWLLLSGCCYPAEAGEPQRLAAVLIDVTASRSAEAALRNSEEFNRRVLAASGDCIKVMGRGGEVQFINEGGLRALGIGDARDVAGRPWATFWRPEERPAVERALAAALAGGAGRVRGRAAEGDDGAPRWWDAVVTPVLDEAGAPERLLSVSRDVTAEVLAEREQAALVAERDAERLRLRAVLESAPVGIVIAEAPSGRIVGQNPKADRVLGHGLIRTDSIAQHADWILYTPDRERLPVERYPLVRALRDGETSAGEEYLYRRGDDALAWVQLTAAPIRGTVGGITGGVLCIEEIGARKEAEAALRRLNGTLEAAVAERTRELDSIWRHSRDMLCVADVAGTFVRLNPAWTETLGWAPERMVGQPFLGFVHPDDRWRTTSAMAVLRDGLPIYGFENRYRHRDGTYLWLSWNAVSHEGLIYGVVRDVTAEKEADAALAEAEDALRQAQKMEAVGQLTGGIAHDFNNLLTGITGALDLLQRRIGQGRTADVGRYVEVALASADRAAALTHRLLAFSRRQPLDPRPTDVNALVRSMEDLLRRTVGEAIRFEVALADGLWPALCDPNQLENALLNLVINARDAMPDGGRLRIGTDNTVVEASPEGPALGPCMRLAVADTGSGMSPEVAARAFDPFFTTKPLGQGTGLGLSMTYGFVRQSGGRVAIESALGRGTAVRIVLPCAPASAGAPPAAPAPGAGAAAATGVGTVLVVEDEPAVRALVLEVLSDLGYHTLEAADGPAGLAAMERPEPIDLLVTDVGLPGLNGRDLAGRAREIRPNLPVLFITGYAEDAIFGGGHLDPGLGMLTKPFTVDALAERVRAMIRAR